MEIQIKNIIKFYGENPILNVPNLTIDKGELIGLIGNNGAGKSTLLRILLDLIEPKGGAVLSRNKNVSITEDWKTYTSAYIDSSFLIEFLTPEEYFNFITTSYQIKIEDLQKELSIFNDFMNGEILGKKKYIRNYSAGNKQKIGIIGAIICKPEILILDEPFNFLDPSSQYFIRDYLTLLNIKFGTTIILSSHNLESTLDIVSRVILLERGKVIKDINQINIDSRAELNKYFAVNNR